jgi:hypothetical protein
MHRQDHGEKTNWKVQVFLGRFGDKLGEKKIPHYEEFEGGHFLI